MSDMKFDPKVVVLSSSSDGGDGKDIFQAVREKKKGKTALLFVYMSTCHYCIEYTPTVNKMARDMPGKTVFALDGPGENAWLMRSIKDSHTFPQVYIVDDDSHELIEDRDNVDEIRKTLVQGRDVVHIAHDEGGAYDDFSRSHSRGKERVGSMQAIELTSGRLIIH